jgi:RimJ/RimL family protein N-acetyltransferase
MRHDQVIDGIAYRLRPIEDSDAPFVLELRGNPVLNQYLHATSSSLQDQLDWLARYYEREGDYYFVVERKNSLEPEGLVSVYDINPETKTGEWGRWILKEGSLAAIESAWLIYNCAFRKLGLEHVYCRTVADNQQVISFHDSCGVSQRRILQDFFELGGRRQDAVEHQVDIDSWEDIASRLEKLALLSASRLQRGRTA